ncbi:hypothetical protein KUTeg_009531, partial [Tegillarca granosa]
MANTELSVQKAPMHVPTIDEVVPVLNEGLKKNFTNVSVSVVDCPDLTQKPFMLASEGLCGSPRLADIGGPPYLIPLVQRNKVYKFSQIAKLVELPGAFMIGAGAGPHQFIGVNSEVLESYLYPSCSPSLQTNYLFLPLASNHKGKPGKVIEVKASQRIGSENFMSSIRKTLNSHYGNKPVALGGVFLVEKGKANLHIMPDFSATPLKSQSEVDNWLKFYEMDAPLVCVGELVSHDP